MDFPYVSVRAFLPLILFHVILVLLCMKTSLAATHVLRNETDRLALLAFKHGITEDPFQVLSSWNDSLHFCQWQGVTCSRRHHQRVKVLNLSVQRLVGHISPHIGNLSFLQSLNLSSNNLHGEIPQEIGRLFRLQHLVLFENSLQGEIPSNLTHCSKLINLDLMKNQFVGKLLMELSSLSKLTYLSVSSNNLIGRVPLSLGNLSSLSTLDLSHNGFHGPVLEDFGRLASLTTFSIALNKFSGMIPQPIYNLSSISIFGVEYNNLHGGISPNIGHEFPLLQEIGMNGNQFSGTLPVSLSNASKLERADFSSNNFTGAIPANLGRLQRLLYLSFLYNQLGGREGDDLDFLTSLTNCTLLQGLLAGGNNLHGVLPSSIANFTTELTELYLYGNKIRGIIPNGIENLVNLIVISLGENSLSGTIPDNIGNLHKLQGLDLHKNKLFGKIPSSLGNLSQLSYLYIQENSFNGSIPSSFMKFKFMQEVCLSDNNLSGTIITQVAATFINLSFNSFTGPLLMEVENMKGIYGLDVSENKLSGEIPSTLGNCESLEYLYLDGNLFNGTIPPSLSNLKGILEMDLSHNNLSGKIPKFFENFKFLQFLNLSFNNFDGEVPRRGILKNASVISVLGNNRLCGGIPKLKLSPCPKQLLKKQRKPLAAKIKIIATSVSSSILLLCIFISLYWMRSSRKKSSSPSTLEDKMLQISYADLVKATDGFSLANLIDVGSFGSVYKGTLNCIEKVVAVKVLNLLQQRASKSFIAECEALKAIRHRNLMKILTVCSSIDFNGNDFKALVFEYMPNGSLQNWLHPNVGDEHESRNLNLIQRLNIAIDVASALDYLHHHHSRTPIVHRDLKPSNILLDDDMVAHVGDFGLAKFLYEAADNGSQNLSSSLGIKGSIGYVAPEFGMGGKASILGDVYSYGILLLELITGKRPTDDAFKENLNLHHFAKMALPERVMKIVDQRLLLEVSEASIETKNKMHQCLVSMVGLGVSCSLEFPKERMEMINVAAKLCVIKDIYLGVGIHHRAMQNGSQLLGDGFSYISNY